MVSQVHSISAHIAVPRMLAASATRPRNLPKGSNERTHVYRVGTEHILTEIQGKLSVYELDGADHKLYCQNLCLLAKVTALALSLLEMPHCVCDLVVTGSCFLITKRSTLTWSPFCSTCSVRSTATALILLVIFPRYDKNPSCPCHLNDNRKRSLERITMWPAS